jgi:hypothetical protein
VFKVGSNLSDSMVLMWKLYTRRRPRAESCNDNFQLSAFLHDDISYKYYQAWTAFAFNASHFVFINSKYFRHRLYTTISTAV